MIEWGIDKVHGSSDGEYFLQSGVMFFFLKISTRIHTLAHDEGTHPRVETRLDHASAEPYQLPQCSTYIWTMVYCSSNIHEPLRTTPGAVPLPLCSSLSGLQPSHTSLCALRFAVLRIRICYPPLFVSYVAISSLDPCPCGGMLILLRCSVPVSYLGGDAVRNHK